MLVSSGARLAAVLSLVLAGCSANVRSYTPGPGGPREAGVPGESRDLPALTLTDLSPQGYGFRLPAPGGSEIRPLRDVSGGVRLTHRSGWDMEIVPGSFDPAAAMDRIRNDSSREFVAFHGQGSDSLVWETRMSRQRVSEYHFLATVGLRDGQSWTCRDGDRPQSHARVLEMLRACWAMESSGPSPEIQQPTEQPQPEVSPGVEVPDLPLPPGPAPEPPPVQPMPEPSPDEPFPSDPGQNP